VASATSTPHRTATPWLRCIARHTKFSVPDSHVDSSQAETERSVSELGRLYPISITAVQKHVEVLVDAGLVSKHRSGREQLVRGEVNQLRRAHELLDELETVWRARLERFEDVLNETTGKESE
jgi:DNA-binding transcriptional ArsR family regulator